jgi:RNA polymerase sigma-70 factor (ECF subfamily)
VVPFEDGNATEPDQAEANLADERTESPPGATLRAEIRRALERRIDELPLAFRTVFVMREVEDMTVEETAECLSIPAATVRTRLFRARALLREALARDMDMATIDVFSFAGERCDRIVAGVLARSWALASGSPADAPSTPR